jgi:hypothetical protein
VLDLTIGDAVRAQHTESALGPGVQLVEQSSNVGEEVVAVEGQYLNGNEERSYGELTRSTAPLGGGVEALLGEDGGLIRGHESFGVLHEHLKGAARVDHAGTWADLASGQVDFRRGKYAT